MKSKGICLLIIALLAIVTASVETIANSDKLYWLVPLRSGFNNQKMMLRHACFIAEQKKYILIEPLFTKFLHKNDSDVWFSDIFDLDFFINSFKNIEILRHQFIDSIPKENLVSPYSPNQLFYGAPKTEEYRSYINMFEGSLRLNPKNLAIAQKIQSKMPDDYVAIHMRIEQDWINYSKVKEVPSSYRVYFTKEEILKKYMDSELCGNKSIFFATDYRGKDLLDLWEAHGFTVFSSTEEKRNLNYHISAAIDFHICVESKIFIGNSFSSFTLSVIRARAVFNKGDSYIYNMNDAKLYKR